jgi:fructose-bisphosphate aldolase class 1
LCSEFATRDAAAALWSLEVDGRASVGVDALFIDMQAHAAALFADTFQSCGIVPIIEMNVLVVYDDDDNGGAIAPALALKRQLTAILRRLQDYNILAEALMFKISISGGLAAADLLRVTLQHAVESSLPSSIAGVALATGGNDKVFGIEDCRLDSKSGDSEASPAWRIRTICVRN